MRRPARNAAIAAFLALFAGVAGNALYGQHGLHHPSPLLATRLGDPMQTASIGTGTRGAGQAESDPLVRQIQTALAEAGFYKKDVDGRPGPETQDAIRAFQKDAGLTPEGAATPLVLSELRQRLAKAPNPAPRPNDIASLIDERSTRLFPDEAADRAEEKIDAGVSKLGQDELVRRIQSGLASAQVADLSADGIAGERTRAAIRAFQKLEGMNVTGVPGPQVLERLIEIGAAH